MLLLTWPSCSDVRRLNVASQMLKYTTKTLLGLSGFKEDYLGMFSVLLLLCWGLPHCNSEGLRETGSFQQGPGGRIRRALDVVVCVELAQWMEHAGIWEEVSVANREGSLMQMLFASQRSLWWSHLWLATGSEFLSVHKDWSIWFFNKIRKYCKSKKIPLLCHSTSSVFCFGPFLGLILTALGLD